MSVFPLDAVDRRILAAIQENARLSHVELSERVSLSPSQCHRRLRRLEEAGVIEGYGVRLNPDSVGLGVTAFVSVSLAKHEEATAHQFAAAVEAMPEILECHSVTGQSDFLLRIAAPDLKAFSDFLMHRLIAIPGVTGVHSLIALESIKRSSALPIPE